MRSGAPRACVAALALLACGPGATDPDAARPLDADPRPDAACAESVAVEGSLDVALDAPCALTLTLASALVVDLTPDAGTVDGAAYLGPLRLEAGSRTFTTSAATSLRIRVLGAPIDDVRIDRSLTWTDAALLDDPAAVGLSRLLATVDPAAPGARLDAWFRRFATTAHSERSGPQRIVEEAAAAQGPDPARWDLDALPFTVTGVHHRLDLGDGTHCGELRVSVASTHPLHSPFHLIFLYRRAAGALDLRPDGSAHCAATALALASLSALDEASFHAEALALLDAHLDPSTFLVAETVELIISPWEWRQWFLEPDGRLENRALFQTVDTPRLNRAGAERDDFLGWVAANADALAARAAPLPERFRSPSARVNDGVPWIPLDLGGLDPAITARHPTLRQQIEIVGCPACHATDADFVQTRPDRTFSPFYEKELLARRAHLRQLAEEGAAPSSPFGPLQPEPVLPP